MTALSAPHARTCLAPGLLAAVYLCLCFAPMGSQLPFSVLSLRVWTLAIILLLAAALGQSLRPWRHARWILALAVSGHCLGSSVLFSEITFHLLALSSGLLLVLAIAASHAQRRFEAGLWLLSAVLSWLYMQPQNLSDTATLEAAIKAYGAPLLSVALVAHLALLAGFGTPLARALNRAFLLVLGVLLFIHLTGLLPLGNARQWLWLAAMSMVTAALMIAQLLISQRRSARWLGGVLIVVVACQPLITGDAPHYHYPGSNGLYRQIVALPPSEILVEPWAQAAVTQYRTLQPELAKHRFAYTDASDTLPAPRQGQAFYLLGPPLVPGLDGSGLDAQLQQVLDRYRCRYTWLAAVQDAGLLRLSCG